MIGPAGPEAPAAGSPTWRTFAGERVTVHAPAGSYAEKQAPAELDQAERAIEELRELLEPGEDAGASVDLYLVDAVPGEPQAGEAMPGGEGAPIPEVARGEAIVRVLAPDLPVEPVAWPLTSLLLRRWFGLDASAVAIFHVGIAGVVSVRTEALPPLEEIRAALTEQFAAGRPRSIGVPAPPEANAPSGAMMVTPDAATAFVAFLLETYGKGALRQFLASYDPERQDEAAIASFRQPLASLEEAWAKDLTRGARGGAAARKLYRHLLPLVRANWLRELELTGYTVLDVAFSIAIPVLTGRFIGSISQGETSSILPFMLLLGGIFFLLTPVTLRRNYASVWISQRILLGMQQQMFTRLLRLPHAFHARSNVGDLMSRLSTDVEQVRGGLEAVTRTGLYVVLKGVVALAVMYLLDPILATAALLTVPLFWIGYLTLRNRLQRASYEAQTLFGEISTVTQEGLSAHGVIKAFGLEETTSTRYRARVQALFAAVRRLVVLGSAYDASTTAAVTLGQLLILGFGSYQVTHASNSGEVEAALASLIGIFFLLPSLFEPSTALAGIGRTIKQAAGSMERVAEVLEEPIAIEDEPGATALAPLSDEISLEDVNFSYDGTRPTIENVSLQIPAGSNVAVVGPSGSGKSTVINLIMRFWDPDSGRVLVDGHDVRSAKLDTLRGQAGLVFQDTFVFDTTIRENIAIGRPDATDADVEAAAAAADLSGYIASLPAGYDTVLGERGVRMSGGQRQRLAIARALVRDPRLLILDEATSALDPETEADIQATLAKVGRNRTTISITHRLTSAARAERIFVLDGGRLVQQGTHEELMAAGGLYRELYEEQARAGSPARPGAEVEAARLRVMPLLANAAPEALAALAERVRSERYEPGEMVVREGEPGDRAYIVIEGQLEVTVSENGAARRINLLNPGDYFGEMALLTEAPRAATVRTTEPTTLYSLAESDFTLLLDADDRLRQAVLETVGRRRSALAAVAPATS